MSNRREDPNDGLILKSNLKLNNPFDLITGKIKLKDGQTGEERHPVIGTSSLRRKSQLKFYNEDIEVVDVRGNISTRLEKLDGLKKTGKGGLLVPDYDALILAVSGLTRAGDGFSDRISLKLGSDANDWFYAVGQGALAVECRSDDVVIHTLLRPLMDYKTIYEIISERSLMYHLEGGCSVPIGVRTEWLSNQQVKLTGTVFSSDGKRLVKATQLTSLIRRLGSSEDAPIDDPAEAPAQEDQSPEKKRFKTELLTNELFKSRENACCGLRNPSCPILSQNYLACFNLGHSLAAQLIEAGADVILEEIKQEKEIKKLNSSSSSSDNSFETL